MRAGRNTYTRLVRGISSGYCQNALIMRSIQYSILDYQITRLPLYQYE